MYEGDRGCLHKLLTAAIVYIAATTDCGGGGCGVSSVECTVQVAAMDNCRAQRGQ